LVSKKKQQNLYASAAKRMAAYEQSQLQVSKDNGKKARDNRLAIIASVIVLVLVSAGQAAYFAAGPGKDRIAASAEAGASASPASTLVPDAGLAESRTWTGEIGLNGKPLQISLDGATAPQAVANFVSLAKSGFYNDLKCHRLTTEGIFVLQCGDPNGDGSGGPGYSWGPVENAPSDNVYPAGTLAMARQSNNGESMGSQFFIVYKESVIPSDSVGGYTVFGQVADGLDVVKAIAEKGVNGGGYDGIPLASAKITGISVK
jgi:peptidyl-prolyl cis-trans isomerase B (cyclophilin B)